MDNPTPMRNEVPAYPCKEDRDGSSEGFLSPPKGLLILIGLILLWVYGYRICENPLRWEESRRCLVACEMIYRGDYIVPRVMGEPYRNKPPLQNWLVILLGGNRANRVCPLPLRGLSLLAILGTSLFLYALGRRKTSGDMNWLPILMYLTMGVVVQDGRTGEIDPLFTFWVVGAVTCFEIGRQRQRPWLQWFLSQIMVAGGILTKGLAPLYFYPPVLFFAWKDRSRTPFSAKAFLAGLAVEVLVVCAWLIPYAYRSSVTSLGMRWKQQVLTRTSFTGGTEEFLIHLVRFPAETLGNLLPWSALLLLWILPSVWRPLWALLQRDSSIKLLFVFSFCWVFPVFWLIPGGIPRYLHPALPFVAVLLAHTLKISLPLFSGPKCPDPGNRVLHRILFHKWTGWITLVTLWTITLLLVKTRGRDVPVLEPLVVGVLAASVACYGLRVAGREKRLFWILLLPALLYSVFYAGITSVYTLEKHSRILRDAQAIASQMDRPLPLVVDSDVDRDLCYYISRELDRLVQIAAPAHGSYYRVSRSGSENARLGMLRGGAGDYLLLEIVAAPPVDADVRGER